MTTEVIRWRPSLRDGTLDDLVEFEMPSVAVVELRDKWRAASRLEGRARTAAIGEIRTLMDMHALFAPVVQVT